MVFVVENIFHCFSYSGIHKSILCLSLFYLPQLHREERQENGYKAREFPVIDPQNPHVSYVCGKWISTTQCVTLHNLQREKGWYLPVWMTDRGSLTLSIGSTTNQQKGRGLQSSSSCLASRQPAADGALQSKEGIELTPNIKMVDFASLSNMHLDYGPVFAHWSKKIFSFNTCA